MLVIMRANELFDQLLVGVTLLMALWKSIWQPIGKAFRIVLFIGTEIPFRNLP